MSQLTIQCRLVANQSTRQQLWQLMAERNTPLINELINRVGHHPEFAEWRQKGKLPSVVVSQACQPLKSDPRFSGQPARFYTSAIKVVDYIYKSWLATKKQLQQRWEGKTRWLEILKSDDELAEICGHSLDEIRTKASSLLVKVQKKSSSPKATRTQSTKTEKGKSQKLDRPLLNALFEAYHCEENLLNHCAISYLLKNQGAISADEDPKKFAKRRRKVEIQVQRLAERLEGQMPKGRDLTDQKWLEALEVATIKGSRE